MSTSTGHGRVTLNAAVQRTASAIADLLAARHAVMAMAGSPSSPQAQQAMMLSTQLQHSHDAIKDSFTRIVGGGSPRFEVVLRDLETGRLHDPATGRKL